MLTIHLVKNKQLYRSAQSMPFWSCT